MGYVPKDAKWYIAEIVEEITVVADPRNVVHINFILIRADSPDEAYSKALELGQKGETEYDNPDGKRVRIRFSGLRDLNVIHDELEHGTELMFEQRISVSRSELEKLIKTKEDLEIFRPWQLPDTSKLPDYSPKDVMDQLEAQTGFKCPGETRSKEESDGSDNS